MYFSNCKVQLWTPSGKFRVGCGKILAQRLIMAEKELDYLILTPIPVFYKTNLYNKLSKSLKIFVVFLAKDTQEVRARDFSGLEGLEFGYSMLFEGCLQQRPLWRNATKLIQLLRKKSYRCLLLGGWDCLEFWIAAFFSPQKANAVVVESSILESKTNGIKACIKRLFLSRISKGFVCSKLHANLLKALHFKAEIKITHGVGIIHPAKKRREKRPYAQKFICIARLSAVKNLEFLLLVFAHLPELSLSVVGTGELEEKLKNMASSNVTFLGAIENAHLNTILCAHDVLILPSLKEPWGLVVEEALSSGLPVLVSTAVGARSLVQEGVNGFLFCPKDSVRLQELLKNLGVYYSTLLEGARLWSLEDKNKAQIEAYL